MARITDIVEQSKGYNHAKISTGDGDDKVLYMNANGDIISLSEATRRFPLSMRAQFSVNPSIHNASSDESALSIVLLNEQKIHNSWKEAYAINLAMKIHDETDPSVTHTNSPRNPNGIEIDVELAQPCTAEELDTAADDETAAIQKARHDMGFTDDELHHIGLKIVDGQEDYIPRTDEENFVKLACGIGVPIHDLITDFADGFYVSDLLNTMISMVNHGIVTVNQLTDNREYGEQLTFKPVEPEPESTTDDANTDDDTGLQELYRYLNSGDDDNNEYDPTIMERLMDAEGLGEDDCNEELNTIATPHEEVEEEEEVELEDLPDYSSDSQLTPEMLAYMKYHENATDEDDTTITDNDTNTTYDDYPVDDTTNVTEEVSLMDDTDNTPDDDTTPVDDTLEGNDKVSDTYEVPDIDTPHIGEPPMPEDTGTGSTNIDDVSIDNLVGIIAKARAKLSELQNQKSDTDDKIDELEAIDVTETERLIASYEEDKHELEEKIAALRAQKADVIDSITEARKQKERQEAELSHLDEYRDLSADLERKIESLREALA